MTHIFKLFRLAYVVRGVGCPPAAAVRRHFGSSRLSKRWFTSFLACICACLAGATHSQAINWTPTLVVWYCQFVANGQQACTLSAFGPEPATSGPVYASGWARVRKGATYGEGPILAAVPFQTPCTRISPYLSCEVVNLVTLGAGISPVVSNTANQTDLNIVSSAPTVLFDWSGDGAITAEQEGVALVRYLLGFRGAALVQGLTLGPGHTSTTLENAIGEGAWLGWFSFNSSTTYPKAMVDGAIFARCAKGVRGSALTFGLTNRNSAEVSASCDALMLSQ